MTLDSSIVIPAFDEEAFLPGESLVRLWTWTSRRLRLAAGSFLFTRRDTLDAVGGFPLGVYAGEELWLTWRLV